MANGTKLSFTAVWLGVVTASLSEPVWTSLSSSTLFIGTAVTMVVCILTKRCEKVHAPIVAESGLRIIFSLWLAAELVQTSLQAVCLCQREFASLALVGFAPFLLWAGWTFPLKQWGVPARVLFWLLLLAGGIFLFGIRGQLQWERLLSTGEDMGGIEILPLYAEYFLPMICPEMSDKSRFHLLPWGVLGVQAGMALVFRLIFGGRDYPALEMIRIWYLGAFSRMDGSFLLVWLICAMFRICLLCGLIRMILPSGRERVAEKRTGE